MRTRHRHKHKRYDLDLHGIRHAEAQHMVENHVMLAPLPLTIITGNSDEMKAIVRGVLDAHGFRYMDGRPHNYGCIVVLQ